MTEEVKMKIKNANTGRKQTDAERKLRSDSQFIAQNKPEVKQKQSEIMKQVYQREGFKERQREINLEKWQNKNYRNLISQKLRDYSNTLEGKENRKNAGKKAAIKASINGTNNFNLKKICPYCNKECNLGNYTQWHGNKCKTKEVTK